MSLIGLPFLLAAIAWAAAFGHFTVRGKRNGEPLVGASVTALIVLIISLFAVLLWREHQLGSVRETVRSQAVSLSNAAAKADTLKLLTAAADSGRAVWERRAIQDSIERDQADRELRTQRQTTATLRARIARLEGEGGGTVTVDSARPEVYLVHSVIRTEYATVEVRGAVGPDTASLSVAVDVDPLTLTVDTRCGEPAGPAGIRPVHVTVDGPDYMTIESIMARSRPEVCNPPPAPPPGLLEQARIALPWAAAAGVVMFVVGAVVAN